MSCCLSASWALLNGTVIICLLGSDGLQSQGFFEKLAAEAGGIVMPMLFIGPDGYDTLINGHEYYGMDCASVFSESGQL